MIARSIRAFVGIPANVVVLDRLVALGLTTVEVAVATATATLTGKAVVVTGTVTGYGRDEAMAAIVERGGTSPGSVSKKTYCVVVGANPGASKLAKAEELGIPVIPAERFGRLLETGEL